MAAIYPKVKFTNQDWENVEEDEKIYYLNLEKISHENYNDMSSLKKYLIKERKFPFFKYLMIPKDLKNTEKEKELKEEYIKKKQENNCEFSVNLLCQRWFNKNSERILAKYNL